MRHRHGKSLREKESNSGDRAGQSCAGSSSGLLDMIGTPTLHVCFNSLSVFVYEQQLKQQRDKLKQYQKKITLQMEKERQLAKQLLKDGKKEKAILLLKKKRYQDQLLDKTENQISNLERMVQDIEFAQIEMKVIEGLKVGNDCLKKMHEVLSIEEVERIMDETHDAIEYQKQIDEMLAGSLSQEDEEAVLAELEAITQGDSELALPDVPEKELPEVPEEEPVREKERLKKKPEREMVAV
ncbi:hypothetical protein DNTS_013994 [Danionella cerebrum]|uniref:Charged multivesicular body protein 6 n=1 Tax=Danionella cerebrum TaxID=2873325 RepID=A0A553N5I9_9TELE|nr:hypothetical protein DNTS_013994 [Danionella translucida]